MEYSHAASICNSCQDVPADYVCDFIGGARDNRSNNTKQSTTNKKPFLTQPVAQRALEHSTYVFLNTQRKTHEYRSCSKYDEEVSVGDP